MFDHFLLHVNLTISCLLIGIISVLTALFLTLVSCFLQVVAHAISEHVENAVVHSGFTNNQRGGYLAGTKAGGADHVLLATDRSIVPCQ